MVALFASDKRKKYIANVKNFHKWQSTKAVTC